MTISKIEDHPKYERKLENVEQSLLSRQKTIYGGGDGGGPNMERIAKLEASVEHIQSDVGDMKGDIRDLKATVADIKILLARMDEKLNDKVGYRWMALAVLGVVAVILRNEIAGLFAQL